MLGEELKITAELAMLELTDTGTLEQAVQEMLEYFSKMMEVDVEGLTPTTHALVTGNRVRADEVRTDGEPDALVDNAPKREDRFFRIPNIF